MKHLLHQVFLCNHDWRHAVGLDPLPARVMVLIQLQLSQVEVDEVLVVAECMSQKCTPCHLHLVHLQIRLCFKQ